MKNHKSDFHKCLSENNDVLTNIPKGLTNCSAIVTDGAAVVHSLPIETSRNLLEYYETVFRPSIERKLDMYDRIDAVFDRYFPDILKAETRL